MAEPVFLKSAVIANKHSPTVYDHVDFKTTVAVPRPPPWVNIIYPSCRGCAGPPLQYKVNQPFTPLSTQAVFCKRVPASKNQSRGERANDYQEEAVSTALLLVFTSGVLKTLFLIQHNPKVTYNSTMPGTQLGGIYIIIYINSIKSPGTLFTHKNHTSTTISSTRIRARYPPYPTLRQP